MSKISVATFDKELRTGLKAYEGIVGQWWWSRSKNPHHKKAYKTLFHYFQKNILPRLPQNPAVLDYACGSGALLKHLAQLPQPLALTGIDGSTQLLKHAHLDLSHIYTSKGTKQTSKSTPKTSTHFLPLTLTTSKPYSKPRAGQCNLIQTALPLFGCLTHKFDAAFFTFPNITCPRNLIPLYNKYGYTHTQDAKMASLLARLREMDPLEEVDFNSPEDRYDDYLTQRVISRSLRGLLKPKGLLIRAEYSNAPRTELSELTQWRVLFAEGALNHSIRGVKTKAFFKLLDSKYYPSKVILDVHEQTGEKTDKTGGYYISLFEAC